MIDEIRGWLGDVNPPAPFGIGDDCAVFAPAKKQQVITVDPVIFGRHFDRRISPEQVGAKLLKRNLSDLAAMGAKPTVAVISLALDAQVSTAWLKAFYIGLAKTARTYSVKIVGGDIAQADQVLVATLTLVGVVSGKRLLFRDGAKIGDSIYVTGQLGGSLESHHVDFTPLLEEGAWLAAEKDVRSMMDVSDGLAKDLRSLTPRGAKPCVRLEHLPVSPAARRAARRSGKAPAHHALSDGEDYQLLFSLAASANRAAFERRWARKFKTRLTQIGLFVDADAKIDGAIDFAALSGYEHLR